jgi:hypothetical protein
VLGRSYLGFIMAFSGLGGSIWRVKHEVTKTMETNEGDGGMGS